MKHVRVRMDAGGRGADVHPMYDVLTNAPFVERATTLQWNLTDDALAILHHVEGDADAFEETLDAVPQVLDYELVRTGDDAFYVYVRGATTETLRRLFGHLTRGGLLVIPPVVNHEDGTVTLSAFGPDEEIQAALELVPDPIEVEVEAVSGLSTAVGAAGAHLSERQREAAEAALSLGYYDVPRTASHEDVADALGCAPSTAAEHLRKAEAKLLRSVLGG